MAELEMQIAATHKWCVLVTTLMIFCQQVGDVSHYSFLARWSNNNTAVSAQHQLLYLLYYPVDNSIELFDAKTYQQLITRIVCAIQLCNINIGATVDTSYQPVTVIAPANMHTTVRMGWHKDSTLAMIKPDATRYLGEILQMICESGLVIRHAKTMKLNVDIASELYKEHKEKAFMPTLLDYITSAPIFAMQLTADNAVKRWRHLLGPTDSHRARWEAPQSVRARFGMDKTFNAAHGSDSPAAAQTELSLFFPQNPVQHSSLVFTGTNTTCCIVMPYAVAAGLLSHIILALQQKGHMVKAMRTHTMTHNTARHFLSVHHSELPNNQKLVQQLITTGTAVVMVVSGANSAKYFRELKIGFSDAVLAYDSQLSLQLNNNRIDDFIYCSPTPVDAQMEIEYFFTVLE